MRFFQPVAHAVLICALVSAALTSGKALADLTEVQSDALQTKASEGDDQSLKILMTEAQGGDRFAQRSLGRLCYLGYGVSRDLVQAVRWLRKAAEQGNARAQMDLGDLYFKGEGVSRDFAQTMQWYRKAAEQGNIRAQLSLAQFYYAGMPGVPQDATRGCQWYRKAAERGDANATAMLGLCYDEGKGVPQDYTQAMQWYRKAAEQRSVAGLFNLATLYAKGHGVPQNRAVAYALYKTSLTWDTSSNQHGGGTWLAPAVQFSDDMTGQEIETGTELNRAMIASDHPLRILDEYLASGHLK